MDKTPLYALFNSTNRAFTAWMTDISGLPESVKSNMLLKTIWLEDYGIIDSMFNPDRYQWQGDYDTGDFVDLLANNKAIVTETEVNEKYDGLFFRKYPIKSILYNIILSTDMKTEEGKQMQQFLEKLMDRKQKDVNFYKESDIHIYETEEEQLRRQQQAFKSEH